jgi:hypothetical protein
MHHRKPLERKTQQNVVGLVGVGGNSSFKTLAVRDADRPKEKELLCNATISLELCSKAVPSSLRIATWSPNYSVLVFCRHAFKKKQWEK